MHTIGQYKIELYQDVSFNAASNDNVCQYDLIHFEQSKYSFPTMFGIRIFEDWKQIKSAIIGSVGGGTGLHDHALICEADRILICCSDSIFCLSIPALQLLWKTQADDAACFGLYRYKDNYIVHGELSISMLDAMGNIIWQQYGADIFTTPDGLSAFLLTESCIVVKDFGYRVYRFGYDGSVHTSPDTYM